MSNSLRWNRPVSASLVVGLFIFGGIPGCHQEPAGSVETPGPARPDPAKPAPTPQVAPTPSYSGFLQDYSQLKRSPRHANTMYQQRKLLSAYTSFIVDPVKFLPETTAGGAAVTNSEAESLAADLRAQVVESLSINYQVVTEPGTGVARIRSAITQVARARHGDNGSLRVGGAAVEAEIVDSLTGERLGAVVEGDIATPSIGLTTDPYEDAHIVFQHWAARMNLWIRDAKDLATEP